MEVIVGWIQTDCVNITNGLVQLNISVRASVLFDHRCYIRVNDVRTITNTKKAASSIEK